MELDEEELIEQEFDNICNKIFSINSLIDIYGNFLNEKSRKYETKQKEINQLFKKSYGFKPSKFEIINLVENKREVSLNRKKITYDDLKDNKALYKILLDDSPLKAKVDLNKIIELMTSELKAYLIDIIDNSIVIDSDKTKESVYEQLLTSSSKIENFFSGKAKLKLYELDNNKNIVLIWQKINQRIKEIVIPYLKCTLLDDNLSEATKKTLIQLKTLYTVIIQNKFNDFDFIYNSVTDNDTKEEIIKRYEAKYKKKISNLAKNQNYLDLLDYIHNKLGITSHEARDYLNEETGDFIVHRMTSFFTPEKDWQLGSLYNEFQKNTLVYNRLCERGDECNQSILYVKYRSLYRMIVVNISKRLSIDEESAMKLVSETGELYGAARIDSILYNEDIRDFREKLKSAKKEYDDYLAADWDGRQAMVPQILQWKLADVRKKASNTINRLGYITACEIFVAACKELKADVRALEKLLEMQIKR